MLTESSLRRFYDYCCCSGIWLEQAKQGKRPISDHKCGCTISYNDVAQCSSEAAEGAAVVITNNSCNVEWFLPALNLFLHSVSVQHQAAVADVCRLLEFPYKLPGCKFLSASATVSTPECCISASVSLAASSIECRMLADENVVLEDVHTHECDTARCPASMTKEEIRKMPDSLFRLISMKVHWNHAWHQTMASKTGYRCSFTCCSPLCSRCCCAAALFWAGYTSSVYSGCLSAPCGTACQHSLPGSSKSSCFRSFLCQFGAYQEF